LEDLEADSRKSPALWNKRISIILLSMKFWVLLKLLLIKKLKKLILRDVLQENLNIPIKEVIQRNSRDLTKPMTLFLMLTKEKFMINMVNKA